MKPLYISFFLLLFSSTVFSQGFEWNEEINQKFKSSVTELDITTTRSFLPSSSSLEKYIPFVHNQGNTGMCVAYSLANCRTIIYAKNKRLYAKDDIIANSFSPFYLYYQSKSSSDYTCNQGLNPVDAIIFLYEKGIARLADVEFPDYWPFTTKQLCNYYPPSLSNDMANAYKYKIDDPEIFNPGVSKNDKILALKNSISSGKPVFFGMDPFPNSLWKSSGKDFWEPDSYLGASTSIGHAMTIIAYDDYKYGGSFQILNSYGKEWGNDGKIWIRYKDLVDYTSVFVMIGRKYEASSYGSPSSKNIIKDENDESQLASPEFINLDLEPPLSEFIKKQ